MSTSSQAPTAGLKALALVLVLLLILTSPQIFGALISIAIFGGILLLLPLWLLSRFGLVSVLGLFLPRRRLRATASPTCELAFRWDPPAGVTDVRLRGHDTGVALGDAIEARGLKTNGVLHAAVVRNHTTGVVLWRASLLSTAMLALVNLYLVLALIGSLSAR